ncbi:ABC transporter ATP-binding protein [Paractinoplanes rishiriensis]|uniref:Macrolide ABC transporter ATP-binding protein n=1 Tax=Paractinoplanes rishiriensis TaxID=1050105 RepID=A0A919JTH8_9ACTN|nr:ABC transporter ATP-binding protein [Actinoplanes rishiriensis]GIE94498.1 macrolide ABC transporter ATP-binding protein [Actinoplanes rishiriensis]
MTGVASPLLTGSGLHKSFGPVPALRGADIAVAAGEVVAVMGPSGSGKSTLLHCLAGILTPDGGEVTFDGRRVDRMGDRERSRLRRTEFGFVFQFGQLVPELPVRENIALPLLLAGRGRGAALAEAGKWLPRLGLEQSADRLPGEVSGGQAQRAAVARALIAGPRVVFADEPTGALDSVAADQVMEMLVTTAKTEGATVVLVTHEARVAAYADRQLTVRDGRAVLPAAMS